MGDGEEQETISDAFPLSWNELFYELGPLMIDEATDQELLRALERALWMRVVYFDYKRFDRFEQVEAEDINIDDSDFQTIKVQLRALGLMTKSPKPKSLRNTGTYWTLTPYGDYVLTTLRAIPKESVTKSSKSGE